ncbi:agamous-like MADS-box protein MADS2 isoform X3 [Diospyros lotus]|uniref:agamous-like MADS-box protein MADS2 isoform X3 n=1 Tax=Diospyros lotus TaxID=55363 RepID=UPI00225BF1FC|nr:agamous-like MADS-box protein MADS2 isoform X3 [Diospyros lotus]
MASVLRGIELQSRMHRMLKTLERYQACSYATKEFNGTSREIEQSSYREYLLLKAKHEALQHYQRQLLGEHLDPLNMKELEHLEHQLETSLNRIRSTKTQFMLDELADLQTKERLWIEANKDLERKLDEIYNQNHLGSFQWDGGMQNSPHCHLYAQSQVFLQPLDCSCSLQIGFNPEVSNQLAAVTHNEQNMNGLIPGWML